MTPFVNALTYISTTWRAFLAPERALLLILTGLTGITLVVAFAYPSWPLIAVHLAWLVALMGAVALTVKLAANRLMQAQATEDYLSTLPMGTPSPRLDYTAGYLVFRRDQGWVLIRKT